MTTRLQFLGRCREELQDPGPSYVWSDALLQTFLNEALNQFSLDWPPIKDAGLGIYAGQRDYTLSDVTGFPVGPGGVISFEYPSGFRLPQGDTVSQGSSNTAGFVGSAMRQCWSQQPTPTGGVNIRLRNAPNVSGNAFVKYFATYLLPMADGTVLDVGPFDEPILLWLVAWLALNFLDDQRGKRSGSVQGRRGPSGNYQRLYETGLKMRRKERGIRTYNLVGEV